MSKRYEESGVNLEAGYASVARIRPHVKRTEVPGVLGGLGGFGALFSLRDAGVDLSDPVLVSATDGIGTKLLLAAEHDRLSGLGVDCVAMCANDVLTSGARPLFFLDYIATGALDPRQIEAVVSGIADGCRQAGCALIGGETAEMPGLYAPGDFDVAGFCVGVADRGALWGAARPGDALIAVASSGPHSNGYSLIRQMIRDEMIDVAEALGDGRSVLDALLEPTTIYARALSALRTHCSIRAAAHMTGGGLIENIPRALAPGARAEIEVGALTAPPIFEYLLERGALDRAEAYGVLNMGYGMIVAAQPGRDLEAAIERASEECGVAMALAGAVYEREGDEDALAILTR